MRTAPPTSPSTERRQETPTLSDLLWEVADLAGGAAVALLPLLLLAVPSAALFLVLPALVLLAVVAVPVVAAAVILVPAYLLTRSLMRARARMRSDRRSRGRRVPAAHGSVGGATSWRGRRIA